MAFRFNYFTWDSAFRAGGASEEASALTKKELIGQVDEAKLHTHAISIALAATIERANMVAARACTGRVADDPLVERAGQPALRISMSNDIQWVEALAKPWSRVDWYSKGCVRSGMHEFASMALDLVSDWDGSPPIKVHYYVDGSFLEEAAGWAMVRVMEVALHLCLWRWSQMPCLP